MPRWKMLPATGGALALIGAIFLALPLVNEIKIHLAGRPGSDPTVVDTAPVRQIEPTETAATGQVEPQRLDPGFAGALAAAQTEPQSRTRTIDIPVLEPARIDESIKKAFEFEVTDLDYTPMPVHRVAPDYPFALKNGGVEGHAYVEFRVDENGVVSDVQVLKASHPEFGKSVAEAVLRWRFVPGLVKGEAVRFRMRLPVNFRMTGPRMAPDVLKVVSGS